MDFLRTLKSLTSSSLSGLSQYFNLPTIGGLYAPLTDKQKVLKTVIMLLDMFKFGIPIYPDVYEESGGNDISEQVLVGGIGSDSAIGAKSGDDVTGALVKVADNIVVNPRKWRIHGYIGYNTNTVAGQKVAGFSMYDTETGKGIKPDPVLQSFVLKFGRDTLNMTLKQTLQYISEARRPFKFHTREGETVPCLIKSYNIKTVAENNNFVELDLELQEFRFLALVGDINGNQTVAGGVTSVFTPAKLGWTALRTLTL